MTRFKVVLFVFTALFLLPALGQEKNDEINFVQASNSIEKKLEKTVAELNDLRQRAAEEKVPLNKELSRLEAKLTELRGEYQQKSRLLDSRTLDITNLSNEIKSRKQEGTYLSNLLSEYARNFESRLHIAELQRYSEDLEEAKLAPENSNLTDREIYQKQAEMIDVSLGRLEDNLGGSRFEGKAVDSDGIVKNGNFIQIGPVAAFKSDDRSAVGLVEQKLGSLEPAVIAFENPADTKALAQVVDNGGGELPVDTTMGNAHKIEATKQTLWEHIQKGGPVMVPILGMAGISLLVAIYKWLSLAFVKKPKQHRLEAIIDDIASRNQEDAAKKAGAVKGPFGKMLSAAVEHIKEPPELIEEVMYETVLATKLRLQKMLPFIAICAASAPLLGLLGTVTGIINTFKLITVFGSGDVKTLSGGISEALITTEFGLIVAIPCLLGHSLLSRKSQSIVDEMEKTAVNVVNKVSKTSHKEVE